MNRTKFDHFWKAINFVLISSLGAMVLIVFVNACLRYLMNSGIPEGEELSRYLFVWVSALGTVVAFRERKHIGVDLLVVSLKGMAQKWLLVVGELLVTGAFLMVLWGGWEYFLTSAASPGPSTGIPFGFVSISIVVVALTVLVISIEKCIRLVNGGETEHNSEC